MKKISIYIFFVCVACTQENEMTKQEEFVFKSMDEYVIHYEEEDEVSLIDIASYFEYFLIEEGYLKSNSKESYKEFYLEYVLGDSLLSLKGLYDKSSTYLTLSFPVNQTRSWFIFNEAVNKFPIESKNKYLVCNVAQLLGKFKDRFSMGEDLFNEYFNSVPKSEFSSKVIYRVPILIHIYGELELKNYNKLP